MAEREYGRVVNVISELAERGMINGSAFAASQAALLSLTRSLAVEWGRHNIRINALGTGWIDSTGQPIEQQLEELLVRYTLPSAARAARRTSGHCWCTSVPSRATTPPGSRSTWTAG